MCGVKSAVVNSVNSFDLCQYVCLVYFMLASSS